MPIQLNANSHTPYAANTSNALCMSRKGNTTSPQKLPTQPLKKGPINITYRRPFPYFKQTLTHPLALQVPSCPVEVDTSKGHLFFLYWWMFSAWKESHTHQPVLLSTVFIYHVRRVHMLTAAQSKEVFVRSWLALAWHFIFSHDICENLSRTDTRCRRFHLLDWVVHRQVAPTNFE